MILEDIRSKFHESKDESIYQFISLNLTDGWN